MLFFSNCVSIYFDFCLQRILKIWWGWVSKYTLKIPTKSFLNRSIFQPLHNFGITFFCQKYVLLKNIFSKGLNFFGGRFWKFSYKIQNFLSWKFFLQKPNCFWKSVFCFFLARRSFNFFLILEFSSWILIFSLRSLIWRSFDILT